MRAIKTLSLHGIPTLRGVAVGQRFRGFIEARSFGITEGLDGRSLETVTQEMVRDGSKRPSWAQRRETIRQLALIARRLHGRRLFHRDFYLCHIFLTPNADGGIVLRVIDLARMVEKRVCSRRWIIKDLAALAYSAPSPAVTRADRVRFLYDYLGYSDGAAGRPARCSPVPKREVLRHIARIEARARRTARHDARQTRRRERMGKA
jgi:heptose I phosphotransferase